jgi:hypothetical protein
MFGFFAKKKADVISHWYSLVPGFNTSAKDFYALIEADLKEQKVPDLGVFSVEYAEGGFLSAKREYLRLTRERLVFDICAAPFGTAYFFSCRFAEIPAVIQWWQLLVLFVGFWISLNLSFVACVRMFGGMATIIWPLGWLAFLAFGIYLLRNAVAMGLHNLDDTLIKSPVVGPIYERWFRKETYYREDTRLMYQDTVNAVVKAKVEEVTGAKGVKLVRFNEHNPILSELYKPTTVALPRT